MESWNRYFTYAWPSGMLNRIHETDEDINLYIFNCFANWNTGDDYNRGEYNIFNLPDFKDYDGIVLDLNNTRDEAVREEVINRAIASHIPTISINCRYDNLYYVGIDNYSAMKKMIAHVYEEHNARSFWFIMGPADNYESTERAKALLDYVGEHNISDEDYCIHYGDFDYKSGVNAFREIYESKKELPDAVICVNDNTAVGVVSEAERMGFKVPEDFIVTGFDDFDKSRYYIPRISTTSYVREDVGYRCVEMFLDIWQGKDVDYVSHTDSHPIFWESCGCESDVKVRSRETLKDNMLWSIEREYFERDVLDLDSRLAGCDSIEEMLECIPLSIPAFKCDAMYLIIDKNASIINGCEADDIDFDAYNGFRNRLMVKGYPEDMIVMFSYVDEDSGIREGINGVFPMFDSSVSGVNYLFLPLHFKDRSIGYFVIRNAVYLMKQQFLFEIMNSLITGIEQLYSRTMLAKMNSALAMLYNHDSLTSLYNRFGYNYYASRFYEDAKKQGRNVAVIYYDLDRLKFLNDNYGHDVGDKAIKIVAGLINKYSSNQSLGFRLGGDEFLLLDYEGDEQLIIKYIAGLRDELSIISKRENMPIELSVSAGYVICDPDSDMNIDTYVNLADDKMYEDKVSRKMNRRD